MILFGTVELSYQAPASQAMDIHLLDTNSSVNSDIHDDKPDWVPDNRGKGDCDCDTHSLGSWKDGENGWSEPVVYRNESEVTTSSDPSNVRVSWADMAQEDDELQENTDKHHLERECDPEDARSVMKKKPGISREKREYIRFMNVQRKKDFICLERIKGKIVNVLDGLELHTGVFSAAEQKRIVDFVFELQDKGSKGELKGKLHEIFLCFLLFNLSICCASIFGTKCFFFLCLVVHRIHCCQF